MPHVLLTRTVLGYTTNILTAAPPKALDFAGAAIDGLPTWRSEFRAAVAAPENGELDESIVQGVREGISFIKQVEAAKKTKLGWGTYAATSHIAYAKGDPNPWGKCEGRVRAIRRRSLREREIECVIRPLFLGLIFCD